MSYVFRQGDLPKVDIQVDRGADFAAWKTQWDAYLSLSGLGEEDMAKRVQALTLCLSRETVTIVENLGLTDAQKADVDQIVTALQRYVDGQFNETVGRRNFRRRRQQPGETFDDFLVSLRELAKTCKFCTEECLQKHIRDQIIEGLVDGDAIEDLLKEKDLALDTAITKCRAQEAARKQRAEMSGDGQVNAIRQRPGRASAQQPGRMPAQQPGRTSAQQPDRMSAQQQDRASVQKPRKSCMGCGFPQHPGGRQQCPAYSRIYHFCGKPGHLAKVCRSWLASNSYPHSAKSIHIEPLEEDPYPHSAMSVHVEPLTHQVNASSAVGGAGFDPAPSIDVAMSSLNGQATVRVLPDSGADVSVAGKFSTGAPGQFASFEHHTQCGEWYPDATHWQSSSDLISRRAGVR